MSEYNVFPENPFNTNNEFDNYETDNVYDPDIEVAPQQIDFNEIVEHSVGLDEYDNPKAGFGIEMGIFDTQTNTARITMNKTYYNPAINITRTGDVMMIDLMFKSKTDSDLRAIWAFLNKYGKDFEKSLSSNGSIPLPIFRMQLVPNFYSGKYSIVAVAPMYWVLQPEVPTSEINMIRMVYGVDSIAFLENEAYDEKQLLAELEREDMQREFIEQAAEQRRIEQEEYQDQRNEMLEELRRKGDL
jgi:hypothetical protein